VRLSACRRSGQRRCATSCRLRWPAPPSPPGPPRRSPGSSGPACRSSEPDSRPGRSPAPKAKAIAETLELLTDPDAAAAEALIADQLAGKTCAQVLRLAEQAALTVDPGLAERSREHAQKNYAHVSLFREKG
jgi:hypothetical protein